MAKRRNVPLSGFNSGFVALTKSSVRDLQSGNVGRARAQQLLFMLSNFLWVAQIGFLLVWVGLAALIQRDETASGISVVLWILFMGPAYMTGLAISCLTIYGWLGIRKKKFRPGSPMRKYPLEMIVIRSIPWVALLIAGLVALLGYYISSSE